jgi:DNA-binding transcriptional ArsR family regulator
MTIKDLTHAKRVARVLKTLGNPQRLLIITLLFDGEKNVTELNKNLKISQPALSQHLSKLRMEGLLGARRDQRQIYYYIGNPTVKQLLEISLKTLEPFGK